MLTGASPFDGEDEEDIFQKILDNQVFFPKNLSDSSKSLIKMLFEENPAHRLGMTDSIYGDIRNHLFFSSIDWTLLESRKLCPPFIPSVVNLMDFLNKLGK